MASIETVEDTFVIPSDKHELYTKTWKTIGEPKAILVFLHGYSDHCNAYNNFFTDLASTKQIEVRSLDRRGWGRSVHKPCEKGLSGPTSQIISDLTAFLEAQLQSSNHVPLFVMGHSMGGNELISWLGCETLPDMAATNNKKSSSNLASNADIIANTKKVQSQIRGFLIQAPAIRDKLKPGQKPHSKPALLFLRTMARLFPHRQVVHKLDASTLCHDPAENDQFVNDPLSHDTGTFEGISNVVARMAQIDNGTVKIPADAGEGGKTRIWFGHGTEDAHCNYRGSETLFKRMGDVEDKTLRLYDGGWHQLHAEPTPGKETFLEDVSTWILDRSGPLDTNIAQ